jgi:hypothetical protein
MSPITTIHDLTPEDAAEQIFVAHQHERAWLDLFTESLDRRRAADSFARAIEVWDVNQAQAARLFGVSRQAIGKWMRRGVPSDRAGAVADLAAATDLLVHYVKRDRIPAVVRRPIPTLGGISLMSLLEQGNTQSLLTACRKMFQFERAHA